MKKVTQIQLAYKRNKFHKVYGCKNGNGKLYQVSLDWSCANGVKTCDVALFTFDHKEALPNKIGKPDNHPSNYSKGKLAYPIVEVIKNTAKQNGKTVSICTSKKSAIKLLNFGGELIKIVKPNGQITWATVR